MQFQVPQFIETESKIVGPLTLKQFLYIAAAFLFCFFMFFILKTFAWVVLTVIVGIITFALAFIRVNGRPLTVILKSAIGYLWQPKTYVWEKRQATGATVIPDIKIPQKSRQGPTSKVKEMWLNLITRKPPTTGSK